MNTNGATGGARTGKYRKSVISDSEGKFSFHTSLSSTHTVSTFTNCPLILKKSAKTKNQLFSCSHHIFIVENQSKMNTFVPISCKIETYQVCAYQQHAYMNMNENSNYNIFKRLLMQKTLFIKEIYLFVFQIHYLLKLIPLTSKYIGQRYIFKKRYALTYIFGFLVNI